MAETPQRGTHHQSPPERLATTADTVQEDGKTVARLLGEVVADAQHLMRQELDLARNEMLHEVNKAKQGAISLGIGAGVTAVGGLLLILMLVHLLVDIVQFDLWQSYLLVGIVLAVIGVGLLMWGNTRVKKLDPVPEQTVENVRKDAQWIQEQNPRSKK